MVSFDRRDVIDTQVEEQIIKSLTQIEHDYDVKILHAIESGSRAWGFHSSNSDYDVRFFYVHKRDWYLGIYSGRDVIELPIDGTYDVSGWDLKKTLHLAMKSNAVVMEWLQSPIIYKTDPIFSKDLKSFCAGSFDKRTLMHHYINLGVKHIDRTWRSSDTAQIKEYFYMLRPAFSLRWLKMHPDDLCVPMNLQVLMSETDVPAEIQSQVNSLIEQKKLCEEKSKVTKIEKLDEFMMAEYEDAEKHVLDMPKLDLTAVQGADIFFRKWLS